MVQMNLAALEDALDSTAQFTVKPSSLGGQGLFAVTDIRAGSIILTESRPQLAVLSPAQISTTCAWCFQQQNRAPNDQEVEIGKVARVNKCLGCGCVAYCSIDCQTEAWKTSHRYECKVLDKTTDHGVKELPSPVRLTLQTLLLRKALASNKMPAGTQGSVQSTLKFINDLQGNLHALKAKSKKAKEDIEVLSYGALKFSGYKRAEGHQEAQEIFARIVTNAVTLDSALADSIGTALYSFVSKANHSCAPNANYSTDGPILRLRAERNIPAGEEITISYISHVLTRIERRTELSERYCFDCKCSRCQDDGDWADEWIEGVQVPDDVKTDIEDCLRKSEEAREAVAKFVDTKKSLDSLVAGSKEEEKTILDAKENIVKGMLQGVLAFYLDISRLTNRYAEPDSKAPSSLQILACALNLAARSEIYPITKHPLPDLRHDFVVECLAAGYFATAFRYALATYFFIDPVIWRNTWDLSRVVNKFGLAKQAINLSTLVLDGYVAASSRRLADNRDKVLSEVDDLSCKLLRELDSLDWGAVIWGLLSEVKDNMVKSHGVDSTFFQMVMVKISEVETDMTRGDEGALRKANNKIEEQWKILRRLAEGVDDEIQLAGARHLCGCGEAGCDHR